MGAKDKACQPAIRAKGRHLSCQATPPLRQKVRPSVATRQKPPRGAGDPPLKLQRDKSRAQDRGWQRQIADQLIFGQRAGAKPGKNFAMDGGHLAKAAAWRHGAGQTARIGVGRRGFNLCRPGVRLARQAQHLGRIARVADQGRAIAQQHVAARRTRIKGMALHGQHLAPLLGRLTRGDQAARPRSRLNHDDGARKARNDAIAQGKMPGLWLQSGGMFAEKATTFGNPGGKGRVFLGVDHIHPACHHRHRAGFQGRLMGCGVNPKREARHHNLTSLTQTLGQPPRHAQTKR